MVIPWWHDVILCLGWSGENQEKYDSVWKWRNICWILGLGGCIYACCGCKWDLADGLAGLISETRWRKSFSSVFISIANLEKKRQSHKALFLQKTWDPAPGFPKVSPGLAFNSHFQKKTSLCREETGDNNLEPIWKFKICWACWKSLPLNYNDLASHQQGIWQGLVALILTIPVWRLFGPALQQ